MVDHGVKRLPVVQDEVPVGVITRHDLLRLLKDQPGHTA
jgi:CBS domain-containing protein